MSLSTGEGEPLPPENETKGQMTLVKRKLACLALALMLAVTVCTGAALAYSQPEAGILYCHGSGHHGGRHGGHGHHTETCDWLFHACGDCTDVYCTNEDHAHRCPVDCDNADHCHYGVCRYADGAMALVRKRA